MASNQITCISTEVPQSQSDGMSFIEHEL